jgi:hypothetical protein
MNWRAAAGLALAGLLLPLPAAGANQVLRLPDAGSFVELPPALLEGCTNFTVEVWVRWDRLSGKPKRVLGHKSPAGQMTLHLQPDGSLMFAVVGTPGTPVRIARTSPQLLQRQTWHHLAGVSGPDGLRLYLDGFLVASNGLPALVSPLGAGENLMGRSPGLQEPAMVGDFDELRVWRTARSAAKLPWTFPPLPAARSRG